MEYTDGIKLPVCEIVETRFKLLNKELISSVIIVNAMV
jgi:hypothetical protein